MWRRSNFVELFVCLFFSASSLAISEEPKRDDFTYVHSPDGVIIPANRAYPFMRTKKAFYTPTTSEVEALERILPGFFGEYAKSGVPNAEIVTPQFLSRLSTYKRQYVGYRQGARQFIWVWATCNDKLAWRTEPVEVLDGGSCFWHVTYDVSAHRLAELKFNG